MPVAVVTVRYMGMAVSHRRVPVHVAVRPRRHHFVAVVMVTVVVVVSMFVLHGLVRVCMTMRFSQVQHHAHQHQQAAQCEVG